MSMYYPSKMYYVYLILNDIDNEDCRSFYD